MTATSTPPVRLAGAAARALRAATHPLDEAVDAQPPPPEPVAEAPRRRTRRHLVALVLVLATAFTTVAGVTWWRAGHDAASATVAARDAVLRDARIDIATVNTADYRHPAGVLDAWASVSTGSLQSQFRRDRASAVALLAKAKVTTTGTVVDAGVVSLDTARGTAVALASVDVVRTPVTGSAVRTRNRFKATLARVRGHWLLSDLQIVSVQLS